MKCTRVLPVLNPHPGGPSPIMPVDMAVRICLASSPPLSSFLRNCSKRSSSSTALSTCHQPLRPCLTSSGRNVGMACSPSAGAESGSCSQVRMRGKKRKNVVFADLRGLALTTVHVYNEFEDYTLNELQFQLTEIEGGTTELHLVDIKGDTRDSADCGSSLALDFTQPAKDYLDLRNRLKAQQVCLETCSVQERLLSGTVQVRNLCFEKSVWVRITYDSWQSFQDVPCQYLNNVYGCPDIDTFSFSISVPEVFEPSNRVEFCIWYQTQDQIFWDNNLGSNYQLAVGDPNVRNRISESPAGLQIQRDLGGQKGNEGHLDFDPFGSPRTSAGIFPEWQSWGHVETAPYW